MKRFLLVLLVLSFVTSVEAGSISRPTKTWGTSSFISGVVPTEADWNGDPDTIYSEFNGSISNFNISATAAISSSKIDFSSSTVTFGTPPALGVTGIVFGNGSSIAQGVSVTGILVGQNTSIPIVFGTQTCAGVISALAANGSVTCSNDIAHGMTGLVSIGDDAVIVGDSATVATARTLPNCPSSSGFLNYTQSSNSFSCGSSSAVSNRVVYSSGDITTTSTSLVDLTSASITLTTGAFPVFVAYTGSTAVNSNGALVRVNVDVDGTLLLGTTGMRIAQPTGIASQEMSVGVGVLSAALTAAAHTVKLQWAVSAGTGTMKAGTDADNYVFSVHEIR